MCASLLLNYLFHVNLCCSHTQYSYSIVHILVLTERVLQEAPMKECRVLFWLVLAFVAQVQAYYDDMRISRLIFLSVSSGSSPL